MTRRAVRPGGLLGFALLAACSGQVGQGDRGGPGGGGGSTTDPDIDRRPVAPDSLNRNPYYSLRCDDPANPPLAETPLVRLTNVEYHNTIRDLIAPLTLPADRRPSLPLETPFDGYSNHHMGQTPSADLIEAVEGGARNVGAVVVAGLAQLGIDGCPPAGAGAERACLDAFLDRFAVRAFRRPLEPEERARMVALYEAMRARYDFSVALELVVDGIVQAPQFLYRVEYGTGSGSKLKLTGHEVASRLSYLLWDTMPDQELLDAAARGELDDSAGIDAQVQRMLADPRSAPALRLFHQQWLHLSRVASFAEDKDTTIYRDYSREVAADLMRGLDLFVEDALLGEGGGLRKLLTSTEAFVNQRTAWIYGVPAPGGTDLQRVALDPAQRRGVTTQGGLLAGLALKTEHSPIRRGIWVMEHLLCQPPDPAPVDVNTNEPTPAPGSNLTKRERVVMEHEAQVRCQSCHRLIDGIGFAYENYDAIGRYRTEERVASGELRPVDSSAFIENSGDLDRGYANALEMSDAMAESGQVAQCFVESFYRYALSRSRQEADGCNIARITDQALASAGDFRAVLLSLTRTDTFRYRSAFVP